MRTVIATGGVLPDDILELLREHGLEVISLAGDPEPATVAAELAGAWGYLLGGSERMGAEVWAELPGLRAVCFLGTGHRTFLERPAEPGPIVFTYTPHANATAVAEFTMGLMLGAVRRIPATSAALARDEWIQRATPSLSGARLGVVGMGHVGREVARMAAGGFGMEIHYWNRTRRPELDGVGRPAGSLLELCERVDVLSLHCDHVPGVNDRIVGAAELAALGAGTLVWTARVELIDPGALRTALTSGRLGGAALDGYYLEPAPAVADDPYGLLRLVPDRLTVTPHCAFLSDQAFHAMAAMAAANLIAVAAGERPPHPIP